MNASCPAPLSAYPCVVGQSHRPLRHLGASIQTFPAVLAGNQAVLKRLRVAAHHPVAPLFGLLSACLGGAGASAAFLVAHDAAGAAALSHHRTAYTRRPPPPRGHPVAAPLPRFSSNRAGSAPNVCLLCGLRVPIPLPPTTAAPANPAPVPRTTAQAAGDGSLPELGPNLAQFTDALLGDVRL